METLSITGHAALSKGIYREAMSLKNDGWFVMANHIPGFAPPPEFDGYMPDIYALKEELSYIIVIVTGLRHNEGQIKVLRDYARHYSNIQFYAWVVNEAGCRVSKIT
jgi:hypothetical protein